SSDLFQAVLTVLDPQVTLGLAAVVPPGTEPHNGHSLIHSDKERAAQLDRDLQIVEPSPDGSEAVVEAARGGDYDLLSVPLPAEFGLNPATPLSDYVRRIVQHAHCRVLLATAPTIPQEVVDKRT